jgi:hypothetical protein
MSNTIELLETIGKSASLRYASAEQLLHSLDQVNAPEELKGAVSSGDSSFLFREQGQKAMRAFQGAPQITNAVWREDYSVEL